METVQDWYFDSRLLLPHLEPGERLGRAWARRLDHPDDPRLRHNYEAYPIVSADGYEGDSVFLVMPGRGDGVEPAELVNPEVTLTVRAVLGRGLIVLHTPGVPIVANLMEAGDGYEVVVQDGDSYAYINIGDGPFVVRDDAPGFEPHDEVEAYDSNVILLLAQLGMRGV